MFKCELARWGIADGFRFEKCVFECSSSWGFLEGKELDFYWKIKFWQKLCFFFSDYLLQIN